MAYVDGFLIPVPNARKDEYRAHEESGGHGSATGAQPR